MLERRNDIASYDTFGRVFFLIDPDELHQEFSSWVSSLVSLIGEFLEIDEKTAWHTYDRGQHQGALNTVNA